MREHFPDELGIDSALWTRAAVQALIQQECGVEMPIRTVGEYLRRWNYTPQRPLKRAYEQEADEVEAWLEQSYPAIVERAEREGGEIAWGDESGLSSQDHGGRGYAPVGETPESDLSQKQRVRVNFIASVSNQGESHFMLYTRKFDSGVMIEFMKRLIKQAEHKIFEIIDNHPVHHSKAVQEWLAAHKEKIEVFYLPSYSPELNPAEYLNGDVKQGVHSKPPT